MIDEVVKSAGTATVFTGTAKMSRCAAAPVPNQDRAHGIGTSRHIPFDFFRNALNIWWPIDPWGLPKRSRRKETTLSDAIMFGSSWKSNAPRHPDQDPCQWIDRASGVVRLYSNASAADDDSLLWDYLTRGETVEGRPSRSFLTNAAS